MTEDPFYACKYLWEARGDIAPTDHTDWECVETYQPRHALPYESWVWETALNHQPRHSAVTR